MEWVHSSNWWGCVHVCRCMCRCDNVCLTPYRIFTKNPPGDTGSSDEGRRSTFSQLVNSLGWGESFNTDDEPLCLLCLVQMNTHTFKKRPSKITRADPVNTHSVAVFIIADWKSQGRVQHCVRQRRNEQSETANHRQRALLLCKAAVTWLWSGSLPWHVGGTALCFTQSCWNTHSLRLKRKRLH